MKKNPDRRFRLVGATTLSLCLLAACATQSPPPKADESKVRQFAGQGYLTDDHYGISTSFSSWTAGQSTIDLALTLPSKPGPLPLIIYLPALGESRSAGEAWRTTWAESGYAVLAIQALAEDATAWSSPRALSGDFTGLARERYAGKSMTRRIDALRLALSELRRRHDQQEAPFARIDIGRAALAGYDLGAYTAMILAGETLRDTPAAAASSTLPMTIGPVIALSPYADFSGVALSQRYQGIAGPVLSITSDNDGDPLGLVGSPALRKAPFEYMPGGGKFLLMLSNVSHRALSGGATLDDSNDMPALAPGSRTRSPSGSGTGGTSGSGRRRQGGSGNGMNSGGDHPAADRAAAAENKQQALTQQALGATVVKSVSTAFLDAYMKDDAIAREWLAKDAPRWLKGRGELHSK